MTFPVIEATAYDHEFLNTTTFTVTLPASIAAGDLIILIVAKDGTNAMTWPAGWEVLDSQSSGGSIVEARYRIADGTETATIAITGDSEEWTSESYRISGHNAATNPPEIVKAAGTSTGPAASGTLTPSWGAADTLWLGHAHLSTAADFTGHPTDFDDNQHLDNTGGISGIGHASSTQSLNASSVTPSGYTFTGTLQWAAITIAVEPVGGGGGGGALLPPVAAAIFNSLVLKGA